jgi:hypothetical protein
MHPMPFKAFAKTLVGTPDQIWTLLLSRLHGSEKHLLTEWHELLNDLRNKPA